jgi:Mn2+/Fe2+ NRAMP family transporter
MGTGGLYLFYVGAFMVLYSTLFVSSASNARLFADAGGLAGVFRYRSPDDRMRVVRSAVFAIPILVMLVYVQFESLVTLVLIGGVAQAMMLPFLAGGAVYFHHVHIPPGLRASRIGTILLWIAFVAMTSVGIFQVWWLVRS